MKRPPLPPPLKKRKSKNKNAKSRNKKKKGKDKDEDEEQEKEKTKTKAQSKEVQIKRKTTQTSNKDESLWSIKNPLSKITDNESVRQLQLLMRKRPSITTRVTTSQEHKRVYREPSSNEFELAVLSIRNNPLETTRPKTTPEDRTAVGVTSLDIAWLTLLYFLIILGISSGVLVWFAGRILSVTLPSNNVGLTHLNQERMWMGTYVFVIIIASLLVILLCYPSRMKARRFSIVLKLGFTLGLLVFLVSFSIGPPPICKDETLEESLLRQNTLCFASGRNESAANSSNSSGGGGGSSRNSSISSQTVGCAHKETRTTSLLTENADEMCSELPPTDFCSMLAEETIYGRMRSGVNYPDDLDVLQSFWPFLEEKFEVLKSHPTCTPGEFAKRESANGERTCKPSSLQEAIASKECFNDLNLWPNEAVDLALEVLQTRICDGFFEFCDPTGTNIVPHCSSRTCDAIKKLTELSSPCVDGRSSDSGTSSDVQSILNNLDLVLNQFQGQTARDVFKHSLLGLGAVLGVEELDLLKSSTCPGHGVTWYAPPGDSCTSKPFDKFVVKNVSNHTDFDNTTKVAKPLCREQESWQASIHAVAVVSVSMVWLLLLASAIMASRDNGASVTARSAVTATAVTPATNCKNWFAKQRRRKISLFFVTVICITIAVVLVVASVDLLEYSTNQLLCLTGDQQLHLYRSHAALTFTGCAVGFYGTVGVVSAWLYRQLHLALPRSRSSFSTWYHGSASTATDGQNINCCSCCCRCQNFVNNIIFLRKAVSFQNGLGHLYLLFMLFLEVVEILNQAYQMFEFGGERDVAWVVGVSVTMMFGGVLLPIPILIARLEGLSKKSEILSKIFAAIMDIFFDTVYLALALIVHKNSLQLFASDSWWVAVFGLVFPALGAVNTLTDIAEQACAPKNSNQSRMTLVTSASAKKCVDCSKYGAVALTIAAVIFSIGVSTSFLINASVGYFLCEGKLGADLFHGAFPKVVLLSGLPRCDLGRVVSIRAPWTKSALTSLQLRSLPAVMSEMHRLEELDVRGHNISWIPVALLQAAKVPLKSFRVDGNPIEKILNLSHQSNITEFPAKIVTFFENTLEELNLSFTELSCYPRDVAQLSNLKLLDLTSTNISYAPPYAVLRSFRGFNYFYSPSNYPNVTVFLNNTPVSKLLDWSYEFREDMPPTVIEHLSQIFPLLTEINLAGNEISSPNFPPLHLFSKLQMVNVSHNSLTEAPWRHLDTLVELDAMDVEHNRLPDASMTMRNGPNDDGLTCGMLERLRTMSSFSVAHNFVSVTSFGVSTKAEYPNERAYFQSCSQGSRAVMRGAVAAAKFLLPHVVAFEWMLKYCSRGGDLCLSAGGSELSVEKVLSKADPEKLALLSLKFLPIGPFPAAKVTSMFKTLKFLEFSMDLSGSSSVPLLEGMYALPSLERISINEDVWSNKNGVFFCVDRNTTCTETTVVSLPALSPSVQNLKTLRDFRIRHIQGGSLPIELFLLPNLEYLTLEYMSFAPLLFETIVEYVGRSRSLKSLVFWNVWWRSASDMTCASSAGGQAIDATAACTADGIDVWASDKNKKRACCSELKICLEPRLDTSHHTKNINVCRKTCCDELLVRPLPNFGLIWRNTPIQFLELAWKDLTFRDLTVSVAPFLELPQLSSLDVCGAYSSSRTGSPSFALVPFNSPLNRNLTKHIGNCASGKRLYSMGKEGREKKEAACSWSTQTVCE